ncbi:antitoxin [Galactobacter valiniphilus]|uniref:antitoxin n=1 Tax=Galactobacter valiniphilus TaxID=2676122 RepID=UPI003735E771
MSFLDDIKGKAEGLVDQAQDLVAKNEEAIKGGIEKVGDFIDDKTGGKFADKVDSVQHAASGLVDKAAGGDDQAPQA